MLTSTMLTAALSAGVGGGALASSAQANTVTVKLLNGITIQLPLPDGTPLDQLQLPPLASPVLSITLGNPGTPPSTNAGAALPGSTTASTPTTLPSAPAAPPAVAAQRAQRITGKKHGAKVSADATFGSTTVKVAAPPQATLFRGSNGIPTVANPTLTLAPIGPISVGVPNFFIDHFAIPPFLVTIFQAAGIEYTVPWSILAAINEIETNYGRNLSPTTAGGIGWMGLLPATWRQYGVDATGNGQKDPYSAPDSIFTVARFLNAAGASKDLRGAIHAFNPEPWFADSVLLRAKLVAGLPTELVSSITGITDGQFPVNAAAKYADDVAESTALASRAGARHKPSPVTASAQHTTVNIYAKTGSSVLAVKDGTVTDIGSSPSLGNFIKLRDLSGNIYTYSRLKKLASLYAAPKPKVGTGQLARKATLPSDPAPKGPATAGHQVGVAPAGANPPSQTQPAPNVQKATDTPAGPPRLFANPRRRAAFAAGGRSQVRGTGSTDLSKYLTQSYGLRRGDVNLVPLTKGASVLGGEILGQVGPTDPYLASHLGFQIRPAGKGAPMIDPKVILDGWKLAAIYGGANGNPLLGPAAQNPAIGQVFLETKAQLEKQVLSDPSIDIYPCGRKDIQAGQIDQRVLATLEYLSASGFKPGVTALRCGSTLANTVFDKSGALSDNASGNGVDISTINGIPVLGHQGPGSLTDIMIRQLLHLQGTFKPQSIISLMSFPSTDDTIAASDHADRVHVGYATLYDPHSKRGAQVNAVLKPTQWLTLITRIGQIDNPSVATQPSAAAIPIQPTHK